MFRKRGGWKYDESAYGLSYIAHLRLIGLLELNRWRLIKSFLGCLIYLIDQKRVRQAVLGWKIPSKL